LNPPPGADAELEREIRTGREFTLADAIGCDGLAKRRWTHEQQFLGGKLAKMRPLYVVVVEGAQE
jgi:hypothetical protein